MVKRPSLKKIKSFFISDGQPTRLLSFLIALGLMVIVFPDVIFGKGTLSMLDMANITWKTRTVGFYHPERPAMQVHYGYTDTGGGAFQSEPMIQFMKFSLQVKQSPYWNPYSATGAVGPETLVDNKFSPFTLLVAILGGSNGAFHFVLLSLYVLAIYFIIRVVTVHFKLSILAGITAAVVYLLNGYSISNVSSNVTQSYLYFPILLFTLCSLAAKPNFWRFLAVIFANILVLITTFLPTTILAMLSVYLIAFGFVFNQYPTWKSRFTVIGLQIFSATNAFLLVAFLWFPIVEQAKGLKLLEMYGQRILYPANKGTALLFFTPKHFWEAYNATPDKVWNYINNVIFHFGIIASLIVAQVFSRRKNFKNWLVVICLILFALFIGRIFAVPGLYQFFGVIPELKNIGGQYLWMVVAITFTILSAYGMESITQKGFKIPLILTYGLIFLTLIYLWVTFLPQAADYINIANTVQYKIFLYFNLSMFFLIVFSSAIIFLHLHFSPKKIYLWKSLLILLVFLEFFFYMDTLRYKREDIFQNPPFYIEFIKDNLGDKRLVSYSWNFNPELGAAYQIPQVESQNYVFPWYQKFYERNFQTPHDRWTYFSMVYGQKDEPNIHEEILDMLSVKYIITDKNMSKYHDYFATRQYPLVYQDDIRYIFENLDPLARVNVIPVLIKAPLTPDTQGFFLKDVVFTEDDKLLVEAQKLGIASNPKTMADNIGQAEIVSYQNTKVVIKASLQKPGVLTMMDNWYSNWKATANGQEVYLGLVNESFRGIALPAGDYIIKMTYQSKSLSFGLWTSGIIGFILLILLFFRRLLDSFFGRLVESKIIPAPPKALNESVSFAVVLPMYNEENNAKACVENINNFLGKIKQKTAIIAVNDGSSEGTLAILNKLKKRVGRLIIENHPQNRGYGAANITGAKIAAQKKFDYVLFMDADLTQDPKYILDFVKEMKKGVDYIKATRYNLGGKVKGVPFKRQIVSIIGNFLARAVLRLPITDYTNGFRAVKTSIMKSITCHERGFSYLIEEAVQVSKIAKSYAEVPYILTVRKNNSKSKFRYNPKVYYSYFKYLFKK